jgi:hypothetical protein
LHSRAAGHIVWAVLLTQTKIIWIAGTAIRLFSLDGKLWFSKASDLKKFRQRVAREKRETQMRVRQYCSAHYVPVASPGDV